MIQYTTGCVKQWEFESDVEEEHQSFDCAAANGSRLVPEVLGRSFRAFSRLLI